MRPFRERARRATHVYFSLGMIAVALLCAAPLDAQRGPEGRRGGGQDRAQLEQRMRAQIARVMKERFGLTDEQAVRLGEIDQDFGLRRRELARSEQAARRRVEALLIEESGDEVEAQELLERMVQLRLQEVDIFREEQAALLEVLTPTQILEMQSLREQLGQRIRALRSRGDDQRRPRRGGVPGDVDGWGWVSLSL